MKTPIISSFDSIDLCQLSQTRLTNRMDEKFLIPIDWLPSLLQAVSTDYFMLEVNQQRLLNYHTLYFDTPDNQLYLSHHNGKLNRFKIRKRSYTETASRYLEVKQKTNKGRTIKKRIPSHSELHQLSLEEKAFLRELIPLAPDLLEAKTANRFQRITLICKNMTERCTIDLNLQFENHRNQVDHDAVAIIEIKHRQHIRSSKLFHQLAQQGINSTSFSKYCIGRVLTEPLLKANAFKPKIKQLSKLIQN